MLDITLYDQQGVYVGTIRTTAGSTQPDHVEYNGRMFDQKADNKFAYVETTNYADLIGNCFTVPEHYTK